MVSGCELGPSLAPAVTGARGLPRLRARACDGVFGFGNSGVLVWVALLQKFVVVSK